jgi:hypothetical protein
MENLKNKKVGEAKERMQILKEQLREEKQIKLNELKKNIHTQRPRVGGGSMIGESYDYMNTTPSPTKGNSQTFIC